MKHSSSAALILATWFAAGAVASGSDGSLSDLLKQATSIQDALEKEREDHEKRSRPLRSQLRPIGEVIEREIQPFLPKGPQSYGDFTWNSHYGGGQISLFARDSSKRQHIWAHVFYRPDRTAKDERSFDKTCAGYKARRVKNKSVWVLVGNLEMRFGLNDKKLESDKTLDAIVKSFDLEGLAKL